MEEALDLWWPGDDRGVAIALGRLGTITPTLAIPSAPLGSARTVSRGLGDLVTPGSWRSCSRRLDRLLVPHDLRRSPTLSEESLALCRQLGHTTVIASSMRHLARCVGDLGDPERAISRAEALRISMELGARRSICESYKDLAHFAVLKATPIGRSRCSGRPSPISRRWEIAG